MDDAQPSDSQFLALTLTEQLGEIGEDFLNVGGDAVEELANLRVESDVIKERNKNRLVLTFNLLGRRLRARSYHRKDVKNSRKRWWQLFLNKTVQLMKAESNELTQFLNVNITIGNHIKPLYFHLAQATRLNLIDFMKQKGSIKHPNSYWLYVNFKK